MAPGELEDLFVSCSKLAVSIPRSGRRADSEDCATDLSVQERRMVQSVAKLVNTRGLKGKIAGCTGGSGLVPI